MAKNWKIHSRFREKEERRSLREWSHQQHHVDSKGRSNGKWKWRPEESDLGDDESFDLIIDYEKSHA